MTAAYELPPDAHHWLVAGLVAVGLPHTSRLPVWVTALLCLCAVISIFSAQRRLRPSGKLIMLLTLVVSAGLLLEYHTLLGRDVGVALLVSMLSLKLLELKRRSDALLVVYLSYFLCITHFLYTQTIPVMLYQGAAMAVITAALLAMHTDAGPSSAVLTLRRAAIMLGQAIPIMLVLFVLFPRVAGPLWRMPGDSGSGISGLSDQMTPGAISELVQSDEVAFRVEFRDTVPPPRQRYWRGPVLWETDGRNWRAGEPRIGDRLIIPATNSDAVISQHITLVPHRQRWLFGLDVPVHVDVPAVITDDFQFRSRRKIEQQVAYNVESIPGLRTGALTDGMRRRALQLPAEISPRVATLAATLRNAARNDADAVRRTLDYFHTQPFVYTLTPPLLGGDPVDEFLFDSQRGFCEHYTAAFTTLMRLMGIPARVVTGYQGAEYNDIGEYWIVRQSDAHAWSEVWLAGQGWTRVDPTAAVAPSRIEQPLSFIPVPEGEAARFGLPAGEGWTRAWRTFRQGIDTLNYQWDRWVIGYDPENQLALLGRLGLDSWRTLAMVLAVGVSLLLGGLAFWLFRRPGDGDPVLRLYRRYCARLAKRGLARAPHEGPDDYAKRVSRARPDLASAVHKITALYAALRYGRCAETAVLVRQLHAMVSGFKPSQGAPGRARSGVQA